MNARLAGLDLDAPDIEELEDPEPEPAGEAPAPAPDEIDHSADALSQSQPAEGEDAQQEGK